MGAGHARRIANGDIKGMALVAVADRKETRRQWAAKHLSESIKIYEEGEDLLKDAEINAVLIAVPHYQHPELSIRAMENGINVMCEKPAGVYTKQVREMNLCADMHPEVTFAVMFNQRTNPVYIRMHDMVQSRKYGSIKRINWIITDWYRTQHYYNSGEWRATWNGEGGGVLINQCIHNLNIWQWIAGMPKRIWANCKISQYHDIQVEDVVDIHAEYENGAIATFTTSTGEYPGTNRMELVGTKGKAVYESGKLTITFIDENIKVLTKTMQESMPNVPIKIFEEYQKESGHIGILNDFSKAIRTGLKLLAPGIDGIKGLSIANAAYLSSWTGKWVELPLDGKEYLEALKNKQEEYQSTTQMEKVQKTEVLEEYADRWSIRW